MLEKNDITIYDIAAALDISPSTVSRALSGVPLVRKETRKKILATARQMGYRQNSFASKLRSKRTKILGAVVHKLNTATASGLISAVEYTARRNEYSLIVTQTSEDHDAYISAMEHLNHHRVDGMLICNPENKSIGSPILNHGCPAVIIEKATWLNGPNETVTMAYDFARHLVDKGCRNIVLVQEHGNAVGIEEVSLGCQAAIAEDEINDCRLTIQTKNRLLADLNTAPEGVDGIIYIGQMLAMLFIPRDKSIQQVNGTGMFTDVSNICPDKFAALGTFAAEILLSLIDNNVTTSAE
jgi:DNA-binding LacI/PurR family transcriptional regulator